MKSGHEYILAHKNQDCGGSETKSENLNEITDGIESKGHAALLAADLTDDHSVSQGSSKAKKIEFKKYAKKPSLVKRLTRVKTSSKFNKSCKSAE
jgi:hypothetical protein